MGVRGELFSAKVPLKNRTYFFNVKENRMGDVFMTVVESKPNEGEGFDRHQVVLFADDVQEFLKGFESSLRFIEKEVGQRKKAKRAERSRTDPRNPESEVRAERAPEKKKILRVKDADAAAKGRGAYARRSDSDRPQKPAAKPGSKSSYSKKPTVRAVRREEK